LHHVGSVDPVTEFMWVYDTDDTTMVQREITYVPGLYKIFDEILVNAADNKQRDPSMDTIKIDINKLVHFYSKFYLQSHDFKCFIRFALILRF